MLTLGVTTTSRPCACTAPTCFILEMNVYGPVPTANVLDRLGQVCSAADEWTKAETAWRRALCDYGGTGPDLRGPAGAAPAGGPRMHASRLALSAGLPLAH